MNGFRLLTTHRRCPFELNQRLHPSGRTAPLLRLPTLHFDPWIVIENPFFGQARGASGHCVGPLCVSSDGRVRHRSGMVTSGSLRPDGYRTVQHTYHGAPKTARVHRLVAYSFLDPAPTPVHCYVNHKDGVKSNNHRDNLEFVTASQNTQHARDMHLIKRARVPLIDLPRTLCDEVWHQAWDPREGTPLSSWQVSSVGRVLNTRGNISWGTLGAQGYRKLSSSSHGRVRQYYVHRLVARAFVGPPPGDDLDVNHKDGNKDNNHVNNLEYMTRSENIKHSYTSNPERRTSGEALSKPVEARQSGTEVWTFKFKSLTQAADALILNQGNVSACCLGTRRQSGGYEFRFDRPRTPLMLVGEEWRELCLESFFKIHIR
mmetsp:Transcript_43426/g.139579  ORF Transcript_43426/g.139579 Transcript_43426/m.139579 type:complete len:374 (-) Transcript_43426:303-1424(-)